MLTMYHYIKGGFGLLLEDTDPILWFGSQKETLVVLESEVKLQ